MDRVARTPSKAVLSCVPSVKVAEASPIICGLNEANYLNSDGPSKEQWPFASDNKRRRHLNSLTSHSKWLLQYHHRPPQQHERVQYHRHMPSRHNRDGISRIPTHRSSAVIAEMAITLHRCLDGPPSPLPSSSSSPSFQ